MDELWSRARCECCRKKTEIVLGPLCNTTARGWDNLIGRSRATALAQAGTCPWCGRTTTTPARTLLQRFERTLQMYLREGLEGLLS
jgi:hypothetical protein